MPEKRILITGYGPFGEHAINASWEAVKLIREDEIPPFTIIKHEVPVTYSYIDENLKDLWAKYEPEFVLHVGVSKPATGLTLESIANRKGYEKKDAEGKFHPTGEVCSVEDGPDVLKPKLDVQRICNQLHTDELRFIKSTDAGLFLCEYIFYSSLNIDNARILFVHVPVLHEPYSAEELSKGLVMVIRAALEQMNEIPQ